MVDFGRPPSRVAVERVASLFRQIGFVRSLGSLSDECLRELRAVTYQAFEESSPPYRVDSQGVVVRLDAMFQRHEIYRQALLEPAIRIPLEVLLGANVEVILNRHNHATLNRAGDIPVRLHRDVLSWSRPILTVIIYLDDASAERGATIVVPGSHLLPTVELPPDGGGGSWADDHEVFSHLDRFVVPVPTVAGHAVLFDSLLFHSVGENSTTRARSSVSFALRASDELDPSPGESTTLLFGRRRYMGNDLDHNRAIPALNKHQGRDHGVSSTGP